MSVNTVQLHELYRKAAYYGLGGSLTGVEQGSIGRDIAFAGTLCLGGEALKGGNWLISNKGNYSNAWEELKKAAELRKLRKQQIKSNNIFKNALYLERNGEIESLAGKYSEIKRLTPEEMKKMSPNNILKFNNKLAKSEYYKDVRTLIEEAKSAKGTELKGYLNKIDEAVAKANLDVIKAKEAGLIKPVTLRGKALASVKKYTGYNYLNKKIAEKSVSSPLFRKSTKLLKGGNGLYAAIAFAAQTPEIVKTYKTCGSAAGTRQLGRAALTAGAEAASFAVGMKVGGIAGAKIGATIGTAIGGPIGTAIGTAIGGFIGVAAGFATSYLTRKCLNKALGPTELERHMEKQSIQAANEAIKSPDNAKKILSLTAKRIEENKVNPDLNTQAAIYNFNQLAEIYEKEEKSKKKHS